MAGKVELLTPSNGKVALVGQDTAVDVTVTVPAGTATLLNTASNIEAQVKTATNASGSAPIYAARAWVNFNGTTTPPTIRASGNVSSVTRNGSGDYTVNFTTAMPDVNYSVLGAGGFSAFADTNIPSFGKQRSTALTTSAARVQFGWGTASNATPADVQDAYVAIFR